MFIFHLSYIFIKWFINFVKLGSRLELDNFQACFQTVVKFRHIPRYSYGVYRVLHIFSPLSIPYKLITFQPFELEGYRIPSWKLLNPIVLNSETELLRYYFWITRLERLRKYMEDPVTQFCDYFWSPIISTT